MNTVAVIPARGGSTRIHNKNLVSLGGHPLVAHTILAACQAREVGAVYVSTQDAGIAAASEQYGAEVIWRPQSMATATAPTEPCLIHAVEQIEGHTGQRVDILVMLQVTSPLRGAGRIDQAVRLLRETACDAVVSVTPKVGYYFLADLDDSGRLTPGYDPKNRPRTQDIPPRYRENGAIYVMTRSQLIDDKCRMGGDMRAVIMDAEEAIDIDTTTDLELARVVLKRRTQRAQRILEGDADLSETDDLCRLFSPM